MQGFILGKESPEPCSSSKVADNDSDDDMEIVEDDLEEVDEVSKKLKQSELDLPDQPPSKKARISVSNDDSDTQIIDIN